MVAASKAAFRGPSMDGAHDDDAVVQVTQLVGAAPQILASLDHPNLPGVSNFFEQDHHHYLVMDFIAGDTLEAVLNQSGGKLAESLVLHIARSVAEVLEYLHSVQPPVIFRDLKPSNIMLVRVGGEMGRVKLIDFGISKLFDVAQGTQTIIKGAGTPGYAPPEQYGAQGRMRTDPRSDIYSLGATLYSLLTGQIPVEATDRWMNGVPLAPPSTFNRLISRAFESLILQMMELKPEARPPSARSVLDQLATIRPVADASLSRTAEPSSTSLSPPQPRRRFRSSVAGVSGAPAEERLLSVAPETVHEASEAAPGLYPFVGAGVDSGLVGGAPERAAELISDVSLMAASTLAAEHVSTPLSSPAASVAPSSPFASPAAPSPESRADAPPAYPAWAVAPPAGTSGGGGNVAVRAEEASFEVGGAPWRTTPVPPDPAATVTGEAASLVVSPLQPPPPPGQGIATPPTILRPRRNERRSPLVPLLAIVGAAIVLGGVLFGAGVIPGLHSGGLHRGVASQAPSHGTVVVVESASARTTPGAGGSAVAGSGQPSSVASGTRTRLGLTSVPSGADLFIDGQQVGETATPARMLTVAAGSHRVVVKSRGYLSWTRTITVTAHHDMVLNAVLVKAAVLRITAVPHAAHVTFDSRYIGNAPVTLSGLTPGDHRYRVVADDYVAKSARIVLEAGQDIHVNVALHRVAPPPPPRVPYRPPVYRPPVYYPPPHYPPPVQHSHPSLPRATPIGNQPSAPRATPR